MITTNEDMYTLVCGIKQIVQVLEGAVVPEFGRSNVLALVAVIPPVLVVKNEFPVVLHDN